jgi:hypothetical protein
LLFPTSPRAETGGRRREPRRPASANENAGLPRRFLVSMRPDVFAACRPGATAQRESTPPGVFPARRRAVRVSSRPARAACRRRRA